MADFPAKVTTETRAPQSQQGGRSFQTFTASLPMDLDFIKTIPAILLLAEIGLGLLVWALIASVQTQLAAYGWVMFVSVTLWLLTIILFFLFLCGVHERFSSVPWPLVLMAFYAMATLLYLTAFLTNAATIDNYLYSAYNSLAAASFFGIVVTLTYGASTFFAYIAWKGDGGNAATSTVPV